MNSKMLILSIAVIAVGLFAMPSTVSLITGQHTFIDLSNGTSGSCSSCHPVVTVTGPHSGFGSGANLLGGGVNAPCRGCHTTGKVNGTTTIIPANATNADISSGTTGVHVGQILCTTCHDNASTGIQNTADAHRPIYLAAMNASSNATNGSIALIEASDRACITCHTDAGIRYFSALNMTTGRFNVTVGRNDTSGAYNVSYNITAFP